jgi:hypothetical protein
MVRNEDDGGPKQEVSGIEVLMEVQAGESQEKRKDRKIEKGQSTFEKKEPDRQTKQCPQRGLSQEAKGKVISNIEWQQKVGQWAVSPEKIMAHDEAVSGGVIQSEEPSVIKTDGAWYAIAERAESRNQIHEQRPPTN